MKKITLVMLLAAGLLTASCNKQSSSNSGNNTNSDTTNTGSTDVPVYEQGDAKEVNGEGLLFAETVGFNTKDASVFEEKGERYIVYAGQEEARGNQVFAARKATLVDGVWKYGEKHIVLRGSSEDEAWDSYIYNPSVVKGSFAYNGQNYAYLMAYQGNEFGDNYNNQLGLAVSNDVLGEWTRVGDRPIIKNEEIFESSFGLGSPELVSIDKAGSLLLAYSYGETQLSGERIKTIDASDLNDIKIEVGYAELPCSGLIGRDDSIVSNCGLALGSKSKDVYLANDGMPSYNAPGAASSFEVAKGNINILSSASESWSTITKVTGMTTMGGADSDYLGWDELYSASFVTDEYGYIDEDNESLELVYSTYNEGTADAKWTAQLCSIEVK